MRIVSILFVLPLWAAAQQPAKGVLIVQSAPGGAPNLQDVEDWISSHAPVVLSQISLVDGSGDQWKKYGATDGVVFDSCGAVLTISAYTQVTYTGGQIGNSHWIEKFAFSLKDIDLSKIAFSSGKQSMDSRDNGGYILTIGLRPNAVKDEYSNWPFGENIPIVGNGVASGVWLYVSAPDMAQRLINAWTAAAKGCGAKSVNQDLF